MSGHDPTLGPVDWPTGDTPEGVSAHRVTMVPVGVADTGRTRYRLICWHCAVVIHEGTTGPASMLQTHLEGRQGYERPLRPSDGLPVEEMR